MNDWSKPSTYVHMFKVHPEHRGDLESGLEAACIRGCRAPFRAEVGNLVYFVVGWRIAVEAHPGTGLPSTALILVGVPMSSLLTYLWSGAVLRTSDQESISWRSAVVSLRERRVAEEIRRDCARVDDTVIDANAVSEFDVSSITA
jgi:hypothetical protein